MPRERSSAKSETRLIIGGWAKAQQTHFNDGGVFDQIYTRK